MYALNYDGLKKRDTYDEIIDYLQNKQEKIKYPDRLAKQIRNTPQLSNLLDGNGEGIENIKDQQTDKAIVAMRDQIIKKLAMEKNQTEKLLKAERQQPSTNPEQFDIFTTEDGGDGGGSIIEEYDNEKEEQEKTKSERDSKTRGAVMSALQTTGYIGGGILNFVAKGTMGVAQGSMAVASGVASSSLFTSGNGGSSSSEDSSADVVLTNAESQATTGLPGSSNDDLTRLKVDELRPLLRRYDYQSIGISSRQIKGLGKEGLKKNDLIEAILKLRSR